MDAWDVEGVRQSVLSELNKPRSFRSKIFLLKDYFEFLLSIKNKSIMDSYIYEFIDQFLQLLPHYDSFCIPADQTEKLLEFITSVKGTLFKNHEAQLDSAIERINEDLNILKRILQGSDEERSSAGLLFPVIELNNYENHSFGMLDSITITVSKSPAQNFILIPSETEIEENLRTQISVSWKLAVEYCKTKIKRINNTHKVIIQFDQRAGIYVGNSLGVVLTIGFIGKLLEFYNAPYIVSINVNTCITGGLAIDEEIIKVGNKIIEQKVESVFYSGVNYFVIPREDEESAKRKLKSLRGLYPFRNLKIFPVENLRDLLDRRTIINIRKQNPFIRVYKIVQKNYVALLLFIILILFSAHYTLRDFDDHPAVLETVGKTMLVKNISGKILWKKDINYLLPNKSAVELHQRLADINDDMVNEIILSREIFSNDRVSGIRCLNYKGEEIWSYVFEDTVSSPREILQRDYYSQIIDIDPEKKILYAMAVNQPSYSCAIYKLNLKTGKRLSGTFWHTGHFSMGKLKDIDQNGIKDLIMCGANNSYENIIIMALPVNEIDGTCPAVLDYPFYGKSIAYFKCYIRIINNDILKYFNYRFPCISYLDINQTTKKIRLWVELERGRNGYRYELSYNLQDFDIVIADDFRLKRDSLVSAGELRLPYTDTKEYRQKLKSEILYWDGKKFVDRSKMLPPGV